MVSKFVSGKKRHVTFVAYSNLFGFLHIFSIVYHFSKSSLDEIKDYFQSFEKLSRTNTTEKDRTSLKLGLEVSETDKGNKELFLAQKVRDVIKCSACKRPRCIYSNGKWKAQPSRHHTHPTS